MPKGLEKSNEFRAFTGEERYISKILGAGFDTSESCSLACPGCYRPNSEGKSGYILPEIAFKTMEKLRANGVSEVYFLGAEPTENPELSKILRRAVEMDFKFVLLISNGMKLADEKYAREVLIPGVSLLMHRHTIDIGREAEKVQELSVGKPGTLETSHAAWENAEKIFKEKNIGKDEGNKDRLMMQCCLTEAVMGNGNLDRVFRWARESLDSLPIMEYVAPPHASTDDQLEWLTTYPLLTRQIVAQLERFRRIDEESGFEVLGYKDAVSPQAYNTSCTMLREGGQININGLFLPCTNMGQDSTHPASYGNIFFQPFKNIENSITRKAFLEPNFRVRGCEDPCQGSGCWWTGLVTTGCYRLCQLNCVFNEEKKTIDDVPELCDECSLSELSEGGLLNCGPGTRPGLELGEIERSFYEKNNEKAY